MAVENQKEIPVSNGAEALLAQLRAQGGVRYIFANTGTDHGPIIEALAKTAREDPSDIQPITVPHEMAAVSMAHGYYIATGNPQMVLVHTLPGTANSIGGLMNAQSANVPVILAAGRTPVTEGEVWGGKSRAIHWRQESRDQGGMVREFVKWDYEVRSNKNLPTVMSRAFKIAMSEPRGPVYLILPREWLCEPMQATQVSSDAFTPASKLQAAESALETVADLLLASQSPLIVTKYLGSNPEAVPALVELAELLSIPVVQQPGCVNFPTDHPLYLGTRTVEYAKAADLIFLIDVDVPWNSAGRDFLKPQAKIVHLERDPLFTSIPIWGFPVDISVAGCSEISLPILTRILKEKLRHKPTMSSVIEERGKRTAQEHQAFERELKARLMAVKEQKPIHPLWVSKCLGDILNEKTILIGDAITSPLADVIPLKTPGSFFVSPPAGHLGWGLGTAIGTKLGAPDKTVIAAIGDGGYMFSAPTACHFTAQKYRVPVLTVIYNNQAWNATVNTVLELYPDGAAHKTGNFPTCDLSPSPQFEMIAQACGAYAERVEEPGDLPRALQRALKAVNDERRQALLNVICKSPIG